MAQKRKKRVLQYLVTVECHTDFMEELCDAAFHIALYSIDLYLENRGYSKTKMWYEKVK